MALSTLVAIGLRIGFADVVTTLTGMPYVSLVGGQLLIWIAVKLLGGEEDDSEENVKSSGNLWHASMRASGSAASGLAPSVPLSIRPWVAPSRAGRQV